MEFRSEESKRAQTFISYTSVDRKMKASSIGKIEVKYSFLKPSQNFEVLTPSCDAINPKMGQKVKIGI